MRRCLACSDIYETSMLECPVCGWHASAVNGFDAYAPDLAHGGGGFKASYFSELAQLEEANFWFRVRNRIILWSIDRYAPDCRSFIEIGCGTGFALSGIASKYPQIRLSGSEIFVDGLAFASKRVPRASLMQMDARNIPFLDEFDVVGAFDVLEHVKEDETVLSQIRDALKPNGIALLTVPQHQWLWSAVDESAFHERRYSAAELEAKVEAAGLSVVRSCSFMTTLLPVMMLARMFPKRRNGEFDPAAELRINQSLNLLFQKMMMADLLGIKLGLNFPIGGSRLVVARKT